VYFYLIVQIGLNESSQGSSSSSSMMELGNSSNFGFDSLDLGKAPLLLLYLSSELLILSTKSSSLFDPNAGSSN
jgi:hypothetical protein